LDTSKVRASHRPDEEEYDLLALAKLADPQWREVAISEAREDHPTETWRAIEEGKSVYDDPPLESPIHKRKEEELAPDAHLLCYDGLYFTSTREVSTRFFVPAPFPSPPSVVISLTSTPPSTTSYIPRDLVL
jgi:hypothetical protein